MARTRNLINKSLITDWDLNVIGIDYQIPHSGTDSYDIKDYFTDSEIDDMLIAGTLVLSADNVLQVDTPYGNFDMESGRLLGQTILADATITGGIKKVPLTDTNGDINLGSRFVITSGTPTADNQCAPKGYVDAVAQGIDVKAAVRLCAIEDLPANTPAGSKIGKTLTADNTGKLTIDSVDAVAGDRVLIERYGGTTSSVHNGIYVVTNAGADGSPGDYWILTRATDFDENDEVTSGAFCAVTEGTIMAAQLVVLVTPDPIDIDVTPLTFSRTKKTKYEVSFGEPGNVKNQYLRLAGVLSNYSGKRIIRDMKLTGISLQLSASGTATIQIRKRDGAGGAITTVNANAITVTGAYGGNNTTLTQSAFSAGEELLVFISNVNNVADPVVILEYELVI